MKPVNTRDWDYERYWIYLQKSFIEFAKDKRREEYWIWEIEYLLRECGMLVVYVFLRFWRIVGAIVVGWLMIRKLWSIAIESDYRGAGAVAFSLSIIGISWIVFFAVFVMITSVERRRDK